MPTTLSDDAFKKQYGDPSQFKGESLSDEEFKKRYPPPSPSAKSRFVSGAMAPVAGMASAVGNALSTADNPIPFTKPNPLSGNQVSSGISSAIEDLHRRQSAKKGYQYIPSSLPQDLPKDASAPGASMSSPVGTGNPIIDPLVDPATRASKGDYAGAAGSALTTAGMAALGAKAPEAIPQVLPKAGRALKAAGSAAMDIDVTKPLQWMKKVGPAAYEGWQEPTPPPRPSYPPPPLRGSSLPPELTKQRAAPPPLQGSSLARQAEPTPPPRVAPPPIQGSSLARQPEPVQAPKIAPPPLRGSSIPPDQPPPQSVPPPPIQGSSAARTPPPPAPRRVAPPPIRWNPPPSGEGVESPPYMAPKPSLPQEMTNPPSIQSPTGPGPAGRPLPTEPIPPELAAQMTKGQVIQRMHGQAADQGAAHAELADWIDQNYGLRLNQLSKDQLVRFYNDVMVKAPSVRAPLVPKGQRGITPQ